MADSDTSAGTPVLATFEIKARPGANLEEALRLQQHLHEVARATPGIGEIGATSWTNDEGAWQWPAQLALAVAAWLLWAWGFVA